VTPVAPQTVPREHPHQQAAMAKLIWRVFDYRRPVPARPRFTT